MALCLERSAEWDTTQILMLRFVGNWTLWYHHDMMIPQRQIELQRNTNRTPQEEAELRGLFAHPNDSKARELLWKEYIASIWIWIISDHEREDLRKIRATIYASLSRTLGVLDRKDETPVSISPNQNGTLHEWDYLSTLAKLRSLQQGWDKQDPKRLLDKFISAVQLPKAQTIEEEVIKTKNEPSDFELFMISKLWDQRFKWTQENKNTWSLWVLESMVCMRDLVRTKKFLQAVAWDITKLNQEKESEIYMCDAWCGSVPILAIYACLCSEKIHCICLELNQDTVPVARAVIASFWLSDRIEVVQGNAITYKHKHSFDYLVSETMHSGLTEEPIVQIFGNLSKQVVENWLVLPRKVEVRGDLVSIEEFFGGWKVVKVGRNQHHFFERELPCRFTLDSISPNEDIEFVVTAKEDGNYLMILTSRVNLGDSELLEYESLITMPQAVQEKNGDSRLLSLRKWDRYAVYYKAGSHQKDISTTRL